MVDNVDEPAGREMIDFDVIAAVARRQWRVVALSIAIFALLSFGYLLTSVPQFSAASRVLIDRGNSQVVEQLSMIGSAVDDEASILSQVEILKSETIALAVVDRLNLTEDATFNAQGRSLLSTLVNSIRAVVNVTGWFSSEEDDGLEKQVARAAAADRVSREMNVTRVGRTYVLEIEYTSVSASLAARIANAIAAEYLLDKLNSKYDATRRASDWLVDRIAALRQKALDTDLAVQKFRAANGLMQGSGTNLITDEQLSELNSALIVAQADTAKARARFERVQQILNTQEVGGVATDVLESTVANDLRKKFLEASKREAEISARLGDQHVQAVRLRAEMREYKRLMVEEGARIAESYKSDLGVAQAREQALLESIDKAKNVSAEASETQVQLRELQREAETYKNLYQTFLQRHQEAVQQQSFPVTDARIISQAAIPTSPSKPNKPLVLAGFILFGALVGGSIGALREYRDRFFRTGDQIRDVLGLEFLGNATLVDNHLMPVAGGDAAAGAMTKISSINDYTVQHPLSSFAETMRSARLAIDLAVTGKASKAVGVVSTLPGEGKSTVAINLAELLASQGAKTILVDADIRNPGATRGLARNARAGLLEVLLESRPYQSTLQHNPRTGLDFLPIVAKQRVPHSSELLMSAPMAKLLLDLGSAYDYVIVDLPPLGPVIDTRAISPRLDGFLYVVEWGRTARRAVRTTLASEPLIRDKCLGVILNKVDTEKLKLYRAYGSSDYYSSRYSQYYTDHS